MKKSNEFGLHVINLNDQSLLAGINFPAPLGPGS